MDSAPKRDSASASMSTTPSTGVAPDPATMRNASLEMSSAVPRPFVSGVPREIAVERQHLRCRDRERARVSRQTRRRRLGVCGARCEERPVCVRRRILGLAQRFSSRPNGKAARAVVRSQASPGKGAVAADQTRAIPTVRVRVRRADVPIAADRTDVVSAGQERIACRQHDVAAGRNTLAAGQVERIPGDDRRRTVHRDVMRSERQGRLGQDHERIGSHELRQDVTRSGHTRHELRRDHVAATAHVHVRAAADVHAARVELDGLSRQRQPSSPNTQGLVA